MKHRRGTPNMWFLAAKRMATAISLLHPWPSDETLERASGDVECGHCQLPYYDHPHFHGLHLTCDGRLLKL